MDEKDIARFWSKVDRNGPAPKHRPELGQCWEWTRATNRFGHGYFWLLDAGQNVPAHRFAWLIQVSDPGEMQVNHHCDNPRCVRQSHLFLGTQADNIADKVSKRRHARGSSDGNSKVTEAQVIEMRAMWSTGEFTQREIGSRFGLSQCHVSSIVLGRVWRHILPGGCDAAPEALIETDPGRPSEVLEPG